MRSQEEIAAIVDEMNGVTSWRHGDWMFPSSIYDGLTEEERDAKAVERWIELGNRLGYTFKKSTFVGNMGRRCTKIDCKGEHGIVRIQENQGMHQRYDCWKVSLCVGERESSVVTKHPWETHKIPEYATLIDMMCEYAGCQRRTEAML